MRNEQLTSRFWMAVCQAKHFDFRHVVHSVEIHLGHSMLPHFSSDSGTFNPASSHITASTFFVAFFILTMQCTVRSWLSYKWENVEWLMITMEDKTKRSHYSPDIHCRWLSHMFVSKPTMAQRNIRNLRYLLSFALRLSVLFAAKRAGHRPALCVHLDRSCTWDASPLAFVDPSSCWMPGMAKETKREREKKKFYFH